MHVRDSCLARHHDMINSLKCLIGKKSYINIRILGELNQTWTDCAFNNLNENDVQRIRYRIRVIKNR